LKPVVLVTGGSRGIGAATAVLAAQQGWAVAVNYTQDTAAAQAVVARIQAAGGQAMAVQADVGDEAQVMAMFAQIDQVLPAWEGRWAGLVNSAGVVDQAQRVEAMSVQRLERMMRTNVIGSMVCAREAIPRMSTQHAGQGGAIVNLSSVAARLGGAGQYVDYAASKGAIESFTVGLARELASRRHPRECGATGHHRHRHPRQRRPTGPRPLAGPPNPHATAWHCRGSGPGHPLVAGRTIQLLDRWHHRGHRRALTPPFFNHYPTQEHHEHHHPPHPRQS
jgi:NADP-dependent 3-hydroxy acid dehydrogenase YdfG